MENIVYNILCESRGCVYPPVSPSPSLPAEWVHMEKPPNLWRSEWREEKARRRISAKVSRFLRFFFSNCCVHRVIRGTSYDSASFFRLLFREKNTKQKMYKLCTFWSVYRNSSFFFLVCVSNLLINIHITNIAIFILESPWANYGTTPHSTAKQTKKQNSTDKLQKTLLLREKKY